MSQIDDRLHVRFKENVFGSMLDIYIYEERGDKIALFYVENDGLLGYELFDIGSVIPDKPTIRLHTRFAEAFKRATREALDEQGIRSDRDAKIEGTLEATRSHLADLQQLLDLPRLDGKPTVKING